MGFLLLSENDVRGLLTMERAMELVGAGFKKLSLDEAENVSRSRCQTDHTMLHVLPAAVKGFGVLGVKTYTTTKKGAQFFVQLFDGRTGELLALMQADYLGRIRTGAASGVATKHLAREDATSVGLLGTGKQARTQLEAVSLARPLSAVSVYSPNAERLSAFCTEMSASLKLGVTPAATAEEAVRGHDILITATAAREPVLFGAWLSPGQHLNIVGSNFLAKSEIDPETLHHVGRLFVDSKDQCRLEAGDLHPYFEEKNCIGRTCENSGRWCRAASSAGGRRTRLPCSSRWGSAWRMWWSRAKS